MDRGTSASSPCRCAPVIALCGWDGEGVAEGLTPRRTRLYREGSLGTAEGHAPIV